MRLPGSIKQWCFAAAALAFGCQPDIGDSCKIHTDCSVTGTRICEPNLPGGYCTIFNCEPGKCPDEAVCVAYGVGPSGKRECASPQIQRRERTFCMARCSEQSDCRSGYECIDLTAYGDPNDPDDHTNPWNAAVVDLDRGTKICSVPLTPAARDATTTALHNASSEVCVPPLHASFPPVPEAGAGGSGGVPDASRPPPDAVAPDARGAP
jgi:hypothetical protein